MQPISNQLNRRPQNFRTEDELKKWKNTSKFQNGTTTKVNIQNISKVVAQLQARGRGRFQRLVQATQTNNGLKKIFKIAPKHPQVNVNINTSW